MQVVAYFCAPAIFLTWSCPNGCANLLARRVEAPIRLAARQRVRKVATHPLRLLATFKLRDGIPVAAVAFICTQGHLFAVNWGQAWCALLVALLRAMS